MAAALAAYALARYRFVGRDNFCQNFHFGLNPGGKPFEHGGYFPFDTESHVTLRPDGISYADLSHLC